MIRCRLVYVARGGYSTEFHILGRLCPEVQFLTQPFIYRAFLTADRVPVSYTFYWQMIPISHTSLRSLHLALLTATKWTVFKIDINHKTGTFSLLPKGQKICQPVWAFLQTEMANFPNLSTYVSAIIYLTPEKCTHFGRSLSVEAIIGTSPPHRGYWMDSSRRS